MPQINKYVRVLLFSLLAGFALEMSADLAEARAGRSRSMGRSSRPAQSESYRSSPPPSSSSNSAAPQRAGIGRALAGGVAGGFLGSMLFSSMGQAGTGLGGSGGAGGIGLIEIVLIAGLAFLAFRWWKARQLKQAHAGGFVSNGLSHKATSSYSPLQRGESLISGGIESQEASDVFFKIQAAFTRRELTPVAERLSPEMYRELGRDLEELKAAKRTNRLENISVRAVEVLEKWNESGAEYSRVRFTANLLDYVVDDVTGQVLEGSSSDPVKFEEDWTFARTTAYAPWQLVGISQL